MVVTREAGVGWRRFSWRVLLAAALLYGGLWPLINAEYIAHWFPAPFLSGVAFYRPYSRFVGGPVQYAASFVCQAYAAHWAAVLVFTLLALAAWAIARGILRRFSPGSCDWPAAAFPLIVLILASRDIGVLFVLPMVAGLAAAWLYMALSERARNGRAQTAVAGAFLVASIPLYYLLASGFLYLCALCALFELLVRKRPAWCLIWLAFGAAVPYGVSWVLFEPDVVRRYFRWMMMPRRDAITTALVAAMYAFVPVGAVAAFLISRLAGNRRPPDPEAVPGRTRQSPRGRRKQASRAKATRLGDRLAPLFRHAVRGAGFAALALLALRLVVVHFDTSGWVYADYLREYGRPAEALASLAEAHDEGDPARFLAFYALARTGRLPWEMFRYPQVASSDALLLRDAAWDRISVIADWRSDVYLELGRINDSQRWAHEALAMEGETPRVLERMALTYVLSGNAAAARTFVSALEKIPSQAVRGRQYLAALDRDPGMRSDPLVARIRPLMLQKEYVGDWGTEQVLQQALDANPSNRMAFEYLLAHYLLTSDLEGFARLAPRLKEFYRELPTHVQEALVGFRNVNGSLPPGIDGSAIDSQTESRFQSFINMYSRYQYAPPEGVWKALAPDFGGTWWFFHLFGRTAAGPPPQPSADAPQGTGNPQ